MARIRYRWYYYGSNYLELNTEASGYGVRYPNFQDQAQVSQSFAERLGNTPKATSSTIREFTLNLVLDIQATTAENFKQKIEELDRRFSTKDETFRRFEKLEPGETYPRYISARPISFTVNIAERQALISLVSETADWVEDNLVTVTQELFNAETETTFTVTNPGTRIIEPIIRFTPTEPSTAGATPLYYREVDLFVYEAADVLNNPVQIVNGWDTTDLVDDNKLNEDASDLSVVYTRTFVGKNNIPIIIDYPFDRYVAGDVDSRIIWIKPTTWFPLRPLIARYNVKRGIGNGTTLAIETADTEIYVVVQQTLEEAQKRFPPWTLPTSGYLKIEDEILSYSTVTYINSKDKRQIVLGGLTRGLFSTSAADHPQNARVLQHFQIKVKYGYTAGFEQDFDNSLEGWPLIDYDESENDIWIQKETVPQIPKGSEERLQRTLDWEVTNTKRRIRAGEVIRGGPVASTATSPQKIQLAGNYKYPGGTDTALNRLSNSLDFTRTLEKIKIKFTPTEGTGDFSTFTVRIWKIISGFATSLEKGKLLYSLLVNSGNSTIQQDTGDLDLEYYSEPGSNILIEIDHPPLQTSSQTLLVLDEVHYIFDQTWDTIPYFLEIGTEKGIDIGEFPLQLTITNETDTENDEALEVNLTAEVDEEYEIDCEQFNLDNLPYSAINYTNPIWFRLLPGDNTVTVESVAGVGLVDFEIEFRARY